MATVEGLGSRLSDPLLHDVPLALQGTWFAQGFAVEIATNSRHVLEAAEESWGIYPREFDTPPLELRVVVQAEGGKAAEPAFRSQQHYFAVVSDRDNHGLYDSRSMFGCCFVSQATVNDHAWFRYFFLEAIVYMLLAQRYIVPVHAACVAREGAGMLLCGWSGAGKSTLAFACARAGWTFVSDDSVWLLPHSEDRTALGRPHLARLRDDARRLFPELREFAVSTSPNRKLSIDIPLSAFPGILTASRSPIGALVLLDRRPGTRARVEEMETAALVERLIDDMPSYGKEVRAQAEWTAGRLLGLPAYRLTYEGLEEAVEALSGLPMRQ